MCFTSDPSNKYQSRHLDTRIKYGFLSVFGLFGFSVLSLRAAVVIEESSRAVVLGMTEPGRLSLTRLSNFETIIHTLKELGALPYL